MRLLDGGDGLRFVNVSKEEVLCIKYMLNTVKMVLSEHTDLHRLPELNEEIRETLDALFYTDNDCESGGDSMVIVGKGRGRFGLPPEIDHL